MNSTQLKILKMELNWRRKLAKFRLLLNLKPLNLLNLALTQFTVPEMAVLATMMMDQSVANANLDLELLMVTQSTIQFQI